MMGISFDVIPLIAGALLDERDYWRETAACQILNRVAALRHAQRGKGQIRRDLERDVRNLTAALEGDFFAGCIACGEPVRPGQICIPEVSGTMHADCYGHRYADGEPIPVDIDSVEIADGEEYGGFIVAFAEARLFTDERIVEIRDHGARVAAGEVAP